MKRQIYSLIFICLLTVILLAGCAPKTLKIDSADTYVFGQDSQENFIKYQSQLYLAESEDSYYYLHTDNGFLYVIDKATHRCQPLCSKSDCLHDKETDFEKKMNCTAFLNTYFNSIVYYDGSIYFQKSEDKVDKDGIEYELNEICRMSLDGTSREVIYSTRDYVIWDFKIHRGYIYYEGSKKDKEGAATGTNTALMRILLDGGAKEEELLPYYKYGVQENMVVTDTRFYGNHIFLLIDYIEEGKTEAEVRKILVNYDLQTDEWENLSEKLKVNIDSMFTVYNDKLIFSNGSKVYECDFSGDNQKEILDCADILSGYKYYTPFTNDGENLIISAANDDSDADKLIFCDKDYKSSLKTMPFEFSAEIGCDSNVFIKYKEDESVLYYIDKSNSTEAQKIYTFSNNN